MPRRALWLAPLALLALLLGGHAWLVLAASPVEPLRALTLLPDAAAAPLDADLDLARTFSPWILHETHRDLGRMDIPVAMDFDGDLDARDNWEELPRYALVPTVYYTVVRTPTHAFLTYHLYHPRDWTQVPLGVQDTHEGDGESLQVVVDLANMSAVLLTTQAHYDAWSYAPVPGPITVGDETLRGDFEVVTGHPSVYVESGGHGIYGSRDPRAANRLVRSGHPVVTYRVANEGETPREPEAPWTESAPYRLVSLPAFLANSTDHPTLFAEVVDAGGHPTPRYHLGDRYSGPLGASRGISPFAFGYGWSRGELGDLFWDPAGRYQEALTIRGAWSREYVAHPFLPQP
jgi:hypothetical protein